MVIALKLIDSWWSPADWCNNSQIDFIFWLTDIVVLWEKIAFAVARRSLNKKVCNFVGKCRFGWWFFNQGISRWTGGGKWKWHWNMNYKIYQGLISLHTGTVCTSFGGFGSNAYILFAARLLLLGLQLLLSLSYYFAINRGRGFTPIYISHFNDTMSHKSEERAIIIH